MITGQKGRTYKFISIAVDSVGNTEEPPGLPGITPDAVFVFTTPLPIELLSFTAVKEHQSARLNWATTQEINSSHFLIEHSTGGMHYNVLANVPASGNSSQQQWYGYAHPAPARGLNYYRLRLVDKDGSFRYSPVRTLFFEDSRPLVLRPNPASTAVTIEVAEKGGTIRIAGVSGKVLRQFEMKNNQVKLDLATWAAGIYFVTYSTSAGRTVQEKFLIHK